MTEEAVGAENIGDATGEPHEITHEELESALEADPIARSVSYSGQDFDIEGLVRRVRKGDISVPRFGEFDESLETAGFQRGFVWTRPQMDRFLESLLLGHPIPGIFFVRQKDRRYLVLDGQQRIITLRDFYEGTHRGRVFALSNVADELAGLTYATLPDELRRTLDNAFIQATIVDLDGSLEGLEAVYQIFERLNSGGTQLTPHEIRVALYAGPIIDRLEELNRLESWRSLYGPRSARIRDQELILRILALYCRDATYARPLKTFLNTFAAAERNGDSTVLSEACALFVRASDALMTGPGPNALRKASPRVNAAQSEAIFVGLMRRLAVSEPSHQDVRQAVQSLKASSDFESATTRSTSDEESVSSRIRLATEAFKGQG